MVSKHFSFDNFEKLGQQKLGEIKSKLGVIVTDYDETLRSRVYSDFTDILAIDLIKKILQRCPLIITTARSETALKLFLPFFSEKPINSPHQRFFLAGGNGRMLYKITNGYLKQIYDHGLTAKDVIFIF